MNDGVLDVEFAVFPKKAERAEAESNTGDCAALT
jgi:hypothetical protein